MIPVLFATFALAIAGDRRTANEMRNRLGDAAWVRWGDLDRDMQVIIDDLFDRELGEPLAPRLQADTQLPVRVVSIAPYLSWARSLEWDQRGPEQVERMRAEMVRGQHMAPVVIFRGRMLDGRHRVLAAEAAGIKVLPAIFLEDLIPLFSRGYS